MIYIYISKNILIYRVTKGSLDSESNIQKVVDILDSHLQMFKDYQIDSRIIDHYTDNLHSSLDSYMFNTMLSVGSYTSHAIHLKMSLSFLDNWFTETAGHPSLKKFFPLTRQACDVIIIKDKGLLTDAIMREQLCPNLTVGQIGHLLASFSADLLDPSKVSPDVVQSLKLMMGGQNQKKLTVQTKVDFFRVLDLNDNDGEFINAPLFDLKKLNLQDKEETNLDEIPIPDRFRNKKEFEFLKTTNTNK